MDKLTYNSVPHFSFKGQEVTAKCVKVYDGDSITVIFKIFDLPFMQYSIRINGIDTAEIRTNNPDEKKFAYETREYVESLIMNKIIRLQLGDFDKYGRLLAKVFIDGYEDDLATMLLNNKYAYAYGGGTKRDFNEWYQN